MAEGWSLQEKRACNMYNIQWTPTLNINMRNMKIPRKKENS